jgi:mRNA interferase MazF
MYKRGAVVLTPFPFSDLSGDKVRPAIIISDGRFGEDVVTVFVTTKTNKGATNTVTLSPSKDNGIRVVSKVVCSKIATLDKKIIYGELGHLSQKDMALITKEIKLILSM